jgi:monovalent cation/hydrogen antiporter
VGHVQAVILLLAAVVLLAGVASKLNAPHPVALVTGGLVLGAIPGVPRVTLDPQVIFFVFLPGLAYSAAYLVSPEALFRNARAIGLLATGLVVMTMGGIAVLAHVVVGMPWGTSFVLGAVLGPTDPVSATAVVRRLGAPQRISTILQGEALINDGTGLAVFKIAVAAVGAGGFSPAAAVGQFAKLSAGGVAVGVAAAFLASRVRMRLDEPELEITTSVVTAYAAYALADRAGFSGVLASVAAGLYARHGSHRSLGAASRLESSSFWGVATFVLESLLFLLVALDFPKLVSSEHVGAWTLLAQVAAVGGAALAVRFAWMFTIPYLTSWVDRRRGREAGFSARERIVLGWAGMRGGVSLAAALSVPVTAASGEAFPDRQLVILLAYTTVVATLILPTPTLSPLIRRLGLSQPEAIRRQALEARARLAEAALRRADELERYADGFSPSDEAVRRVRDRYEMRLRRFSEQLDADDGEQPGDVEEYHRLSHELIEVERAELRRLKRERALPQSALLEIERDLDLDESRLGASSRTAAV